MSISIKPTAAQKKRAEEAKKGNLVLPKSTEPPWKGKKKS